MHDWIARRMFKTFALNWYIHGTARARRDMIHTACSRIYAQKKRIIHHSLTQSTKVQNPSALFIRMRKSIANLFIYYFFFFGRTKIEYTYARTRIEYTYAKEQRKNKNRIYICKKKKTDKRIQQTTTTTKNYYKVSNLPTSPQSLVAGIVAITDAAFPR